MIDQGKEVKGSGYRLALPPFKEEAAKKEVKREHNIIIEAKLVRLLKREKGGLGVDQLSEKSGYPPELVELATKRLVSKGLAAEEGSLFVYGA